MSNPKFKAGDAVQYEGTGEVMHLVFGALAPVRTHDWEALFPNRPDEFCYLVDSGPTTRLVPEGRLTRVEQWEPCPGTHRHIGGSEGVKYCNLERLVEEEANA